MICNAQMHTKYFKEAVNLRIKQTPALQKIYGHDGVHKICAEHIRPRKATINNNCTLWRF